MLPVDVQPGQWTSLNCPKCSGTLEFQEFYGRSTLSGEVFHKAWLKCSAYACGFVVILGPVDTNVIQEVP